MKKLMETGPYLYAAALAGFGIIQLVTQNFLTGLLPVPESLPLKRPLWIYLTSGIFLMVAGAIFFNARQQLAALTAGGLFLFFFLFLDIPKLISDIYNAGQWAATFETVMLFSGAFIMAPYLTNEPVDGPQWSRIINSMSVLSRYLFALSLCDLCHPTYKIRGLYRDPYTRLAAGDCGLVLSCDRGISAGSDQLCHTRSVVSGFRHIGKYVPGGGW